MEEETGLITEDTSVFVEGGEGMYVPVLYPLFHEICSNRRTPNRQQRQRFSNAFIPVFFRALDAPQYFDIFLSNFDQVYAQIAERYERNPDLCLPSSTFIDQLRYVTKRLEITNIAPSPEAIIHLFLLSQSDHVLSELASQTLRAILIEVDFETTISRFEGLGIRMAQAAISNDHERVLLIYNIFQAEFLSGEQRSQFLDSFTRNFVSASYGANENNRVNYTSFYLYEIIRRSLRVVSSNLETEYETNLLDAARHTISESYFLPDERFITVIFMILQRNINSLRFQQEAETQLAEMRQMILPIIERQERLASACLFLPRGASAKAKFERSSPKSLTQIGAMIMENNIQSLQLLAMPFTHIITDAPSEIGDMFRQLIMHTDDIHRISVSAGGRSRLLTLFREDGSPYPRGEAPFNVSQEVATVVFRQENQAARILPLRETWDLINYLIVPMTTIIPWHDMEFCPDFDSSLAEEFDWKENLELLRRLVRSEFKWSLSSRGDCLILPERTLLREVFGFTSVTYSIIPPAVLPGAVLVELASFQSTLRFAITSDFHLVMLGDEDLQAVLRNPNDELILTKKDEFASLWYSYFLLMGYREIISGNVTSLSKGTQQTGSKPRGGAVAFTDRRAHRRLLQEGHHFTESQRKLALTYGVDLHQVNTDEGTWVDVEVVGKDGRREIQIRGRYTYVTKTDVSPRKIRQLPPHDWQY